MNRNSENHFAVNPQVDIGRSCFKRNSDHKTTFDAGDLIPIYVDEVLPGDTFSMDMSALVRMTTPIFPTMDNAVFAVQLFPVVPQNPRRSVEEVEVDCRVVHRREDWRGHTHKCTHIHAEGVAR